MTTSARYNAIRRRLRMTQAEVAETTGYWLGYVSKWGHTGASSVDPPEAALARLEGLEGLLREPALRDQADLDAKAA